MITVVKARVENERVLTLQVQDSSGEEHKCWIEEPKFNVLNGEAMTIMQSLDGWAERALVDVASWSPSVRGATRDAVILVLARRFWDDAATGKLKNGSVQIPTREEAMQLVGTGWSHWEPFN